MRHLSQNSPSYPRCSACPPRQSTPTAGQWPCWRVPTSCNSCSASPPWPHLGAWAGQWHILVAVRPGQPQRHRTVAHHALSGRNGSPDSVLGIQPQRRPSTHAYPLGRCVLGDPGVYRRSLGQRCFSAHASRQTAVAGHHPLFAIGMAGSAISTYSVYRLMTLVAAGLILSPTTLWLLTEPGDELRLLALSTLAFSAIVVRATRELSSALH